MKNKLFTVVLILAVAALIYNNRSSGFDKWRDRRRLENSIEEMTGLDLDLRDLFKGLESTSDRLTDTGEEKLDDLKERLETLSQEELEALADLMDEKGDEAEALFQDVIDRVSERVNP